MSLDVERRIRDRAYAIWLEQGCPDGCDADHWLQAERDVAAQAEGVAAPTKAAPRKAVRKSKAEPVTTLSAAVETAAPELVAESPKTRKPRARKTVPA
ncbi:hypothetical protein J2847_000868 [Azospirillum agricola]|uniref:DUF2934 domain-containing protein n=1 Tax=Azospirillum agricola TaxID=1720247 RepID=UPI001F1E1356|nr:DUF2934 domain-containing protein [Azospirillum agricola]MBP2227588.1 hypothetical protein [Azospirillum agricola]